MWKPLVGFVMISPINILPYLVANVKGLVIIVPSSVLEISSHGAPVCLQQDVCVFQNNLDTGKRHSYSGSAYHKTSIRPLCFHSHSCTYQPIRLMIQCLTLKDKYRLKLEYCRLEQNNCPEMTFRKDDTAGSFWH